MKHLILIIGLFSFILSNPPNLVAQNSANSEVQVQPDSSKNDATFKTGEDEPYSLIELVMGSVFGILATLFRGTGLKVLQLLETGFDILIEYMRNKKESNKGPPIPEGLKGTEKDI